MEVLDTFAAVCFDFDGTLADNFDAIASAVNHVRAGRDLPPLSTGQVKPFVGRGIDYLVAQALPVGELADNIARYRAIFPSVMRQGTSLLPGAAEALAHLRGRGKRLGLCSNKLSQFSRELLGYLGIADYFAVVLGPEDVGRPKPAPDILLAAGERLAAAPARLLYIGDMDVDVQTARAAGTKVWAVATGTQPRTVLQAANPDRVLDSLRELLEE
jgi:phosphoglycolate phosphatase